MYLKDLEMFDEASDTPTVARTSNLNEELGQVSWHLCHSGVRSVSLCIV